MINELLNKNVLDILSSYEKALSTREEYELGFNLFSLISETYHLENFHSNILYHILNPKSKHNEGYKYLNLFIQFINECNNNINIDIADFKDAEVYSEFSLEEQRRIDICIISEEKKKAIIIENKINNAPDMPNQLPAYYNYITNVTECEVDAIIYLSIDGNKFPDLQKWKVSSEEANKIKSKLLQLSAFDISEKNHRDICHGWLQNCLNETDKYSENYFVLKQYSDLLKTLRGYIMETIQLENLFKEVNGNENTIHNLDLLNDMLKNMYLYVGERFAEKLSSRNIAPNLEIIFYHDHHLIIKFTDPKFYNYYLKLSWNDIKHYQLRIMQNDNDWKLDEKIKRYKFDANYKFSDKDDCWIINSEESYNIFDLKQEEDLLNKIETIIKEFHEIISNPDLI